MLCIVVCCSPSGVVVFLLFCDHSDYNGIGDDGEDANSGYKESNNLDRRTSQPVDVGISNVILPFESHNLP